MPQHTDIDLQYHPHAQRFDRQRVLNAYQAALRVLEHNPLSPLAETFHDQVRVFGEWLRDPVGMSSETCAEVERLLRVSPRLGPIASHFDVMAVKTVAEAALTLEDLDGREGCEGIEEYGDVFEFLAEILRCQKCYSNKYYNAVDPNTGRQFTWGTIAQALLADAGLLLPRHHLPLSDRIYRPPRPADSAPLVESIRDVSQILCIKFRAVAWQIVKYFVYIESPGGPKQSIRLGNWQQLADHAIRAERLFLNEANHENATRRRRRAAATMSWVARCTLMRWMDDSHGYYTPGVRALEASRRLAETGDPRSNRSRRSEPLFYLPAVALADVSREVDEPESSDEIYEAL
ncbi:hypothetical protein VTO42DRAFT_615 [Malbranchea cinnamomea]